MKQTQIVEAMNQVRAAFYAHSIDKQALRPHEQEDIQETHDRFEHALARLWLAASSSKKAA